MPNTSSKSNDASTPSKDAPTAKPTPPIKPGETTSDAPNTDNTNGLNAEQKPKVDRGDPAVNPGVAAAGAANAQFADYPHNQSGGLPKKEVKQDQADRISEAEWDALPAQSSRKLGYSRENRPPKDQTF